MQSSRELPGRRGFMKMLALGAAALPLLGRAGLSWAQSSAPPGASAPQKPVAAPAVAPSASTPEELSPDVAALSRLLQRRYGKLLTEAQLKELAPDLDRMVRNGERLRQNHLENAQEPDFVFRAIPWR